jgi:DNA modification methylase
MPVKKENITIVHKSVNDLIPYVNNARTHSDDQVNQIASSIKEFGFTNPVLVDGENGIIAGHGRVMAAKKLNIQEVPTIELAHLTDTQKKAYILADNKLALNAGWDDQLLSLELLGLQEADFDLDLIGFSQEEVDEILSPDIEQCEGRTDPDEVPEVAAAAKTKPGDVWILGKHRLMCGDSTSVDDVEILLSSGGMIDICLTSPPYNASVVITDGKHKKKYINNDDNLSQREYSDFLQSFVNVAINHCEYIFVNIQSLANNKLALIDFLYAEREYLADYIIWDKCSSEPAMACNVMNSEFEFIYVFSKKANRAIGTIEFRGDVPNIVHIPSRVEKDFSCIHKATFPVAFSDHFVSSFAAESVFDPFGGTGTTLISCEKLGRKSRLMELDPKYCDVIINRWQNFTGNDAVLESTKQTYNSIDD